MFVLRVSIGRTSVCAFLGVKASHVHLMYVQSPVPLFDDGIQNVTAMGTVHCSCSVSDVVILQTHTNFHILPSSLHILASVLINEALYSVCSYSM